MYITELPRKTTNILWECKSVAMLEENDFLTHSLLLKYLNGK